MKIEIGVETEIANDKDNNDYGSVSLISITVQFDNRKIEIRINNIFCYRMMILLFINFTLFQ